VDYPASFLPDSKAKGATDAVSHINAQAQACPDQKFVLVGYSQGADVMHDAAAKLDPSVFPRIVAVVMFGDPGNKGPGALSPLGGKVAVFPADLQAKLKENCATGDPVCSSGLDISAHLTYVSGDYMSQSASYILKQFQSGGKAGASPSPNGGPNDKAPAGNASAMQALGSLLGASPAQMSSLGQAMKGGS
jgi:cutinase